MAIGQESDRKSCWPLESDSAHAFRLPRCTQMAASDATPPLLPSCSPLFVRPHL